MVGFPFSDRALEQRLFTQFGPACYLGHAMCLGNLAQCQKQRSRVVHFEHGFQYAAASGPTMAALLAL